MPAPIPLREEETPLLDLGVVEWRYQCLVGAGYPVEQALQLAEDGEIDLHLAVSLLEHGCPLEQALAIVL